MKMRVLVVLLSAVWLALMPLAASAQAGFTEPVRQVLATTGKVMSITNDRVHVSGTGSYDEVILTVPAANHIVNAETGLPTDSLAVGMAVTAYYSPVLTRSLPPQGQAIALLIGENPVPGKIGTYLQVAKVTPTSNGGVRVLCTNGERLITIMPEVFVNIDDIKAGTELVVWYDKMALSMPGQAMALKVRLLDAKPDLYVHTTAGVIVVNGRELPLAADDLIERQGNTVMVPLRIVAESLGYQVVWQGNNKIDVVNAKTAFSLSLDNTSYLSDQTPITLKVAPKLVNNKTLVPIEFFTKVMQLKVDVSHGHV